MNKLTSILLISGLVLTSSVAYSDQHGTAKPDVLTIAYNASASDSAKVVIFYVSHLDTPFLDPIDQ